jgi:hypothetical protein
MKPRWIVLPILAASVVAVPAASAQQHSYRPAPPAVAPYAPVAYPGQAILPGARVDTTAGTVKLPLHRGRMADGRVVWHVITDASDAKVARKLRLNHSPKLANTPAAAARTARMASDGTLVFDQGAVDFAPERRVVPGSGAEAFPPAVAEPGSVGDARYSPLVRVKNRGGVVLNATVVAFDVSAREIEFPSGGVDHAKVIDRAVAISAAARTVTFGLSLGMASAHPILFVSLDSSSPLVSALEATTVAPALAQLPVGRDDAPDSAVSANYLITNGPTGASNPQRQGLDSALSDAGAQVLDVFDGAPGVLNGELYSPMWDLYVSAWTPAAIAAGHRARIESELELLGRAHEGWITGLGGGPVGPSGLISNCPLIMRF